jgi:hypothetical protein
MKLHPVYVFCYFTVFCYISLFCKWSSSVATYTLGLYCSVNRQDMKLDRVSVFCYIPVLFNCVCSVATDTLVLQGGFEVSRH